MHGNLSISSSEELSSLQGLEALRRVPGRLTLAGLSLLHPATTIHSLSISNTGLTSLAGIDARVQCTLRISQNPALSDLGEYAKNPGPVANSVSISGNLCCRSAASAPC